MSDKTISRSENMRRIKSKDMEPELSVRRLVHSLGFRYRLHSKELPGKPDLVFNSMKKVIFVNGCFWHSHHDPTCADSHDPKSNRDYWLPKLARNRQRDRENTKALTERGYNVLVVWECQTKDTAKVRKLLKEFLRK